VIMEPVSVGEGTREVQPLRGDLYGLFVLPYFVEGEAQIGIRTGVRPIGLNCSTVLVNCSVPFVLTRQGENLRL
jgi:hypothetical protein